MTALDSIETRLEFTEEQAMLRDQARRLLHTRSSVEAVRELLADSRGDDPALWTELGAMGWLGLITPVDQGGAGLGAVELATLSEEAGRALLPSPVLGHLLSTAILIEGGSDAQRADWLPRLASGESRATYAHVEPGGAWRVYETMTEERSGRLYGEKAFVWAADTADLYLIPVRSGANIRVALVTRGCAGIEIRNEETLDRTRRQGRLALDDVAAESFLEKPAEEIERRILPQISTALAAESVGGADAALNLTAAYAAEREQFGKKIGSFQAIKHPLVNVLIAVEQARSLVYAAACALDQERPEAGLLAHMAKATAADAFGFATSRAIQFHGGFGFTEECDAHLYRRRALASRPAFGTPDEHRAQIGALLFDPPEA